MNLAKLTTPVYPTAAVDPAELLARYRAAFSPLQLCAEELCTRAYGTPALTSAQLAVLAYFRAHWAVRATAENLSLSIYGSGWARDDITAALRFWVKRGLLRTARTDGRTMYELALPAVPAST